MSNDRDLPSREIKSRGQRFFWLLFFFSVFSFFCFFRLYESPGFHFDEAWAATFASRIANEPGFFPWQAMSPYTSAYPHYWAALWYHFFGENLRVFRWSQVFLFWGGVLQLAYLLQRLFPGRSIGALFLGLVCGVSGLFFNARFAVEVNGFLVLMFSLFVHSVLVQNRILPLLVWWVGSTCHLLFYPIGLVYLLWLVLTDRAKETPKHVFGLFFVLFFLYFLKVAWQVPEKGKSILLVCSSLALFLPLFPHVASSFQRMWMRWLEPKRKILSWICLPVLVNALVFAEGGFTLATQTGSLAVQWYLVVVLLAYGAVGTMLFVSGIRVLPIENRKYLYLWLLLVAVILLKPAPRYYTLPMLALVSICALGISELPKKLRIFVIGLALTHSAVLQAKHHWLTPEMKQFRFFFWKDSSKDFLSKQKLLDALGHCEDSAIESIDYRVKLAVDFLRRTDPPAQLSCLGKGIVVLSPDDRSELAHKRVIHLAGWKIFLDPEGK